MVLPVSHEQACTLHHISSIAIDGFCSLHALPGSWYSAFYHTYHFLYTRPQHVTFWCVLQLICITYAIPHNIKLVYSVLLVPAIIIILSIGPISLYYKDHKSARYKRVISLYWTAAIMVIVLTYPMVSRMVIETFACKRLGQDGHFLRYVCDVCCISHERLYTISGSNYTSHKHASSLPSELR
jgi:hypothetical protein